MALIRSRLALWQLMLEIGVLAACLAVLRVSIALGVIAACVSCLSLMRTARIVRGREQPGARLSRYRLCRAGLESFVVSCCIIGAGAITSLLVYGLAGSVLSGGWIHEIDLGALVLSVVSGLVVSYLVRRRLWDWRAEPGNLGEQRDPADPRVGGPQISGVRRRAVER
jgi:hypothetical protein